MHVDELIAGRFRVLERVGQGGMGQVFRAEDLDSGRIVALKRMTSLDAGLIERFMLEAKTLASLSHPAIVGYVAHGMTGEHEPFLVMDWLEGEDLSHTLERGGLGLRDGWTVVRRIAEALATAHAQGVIHRDLKPANVMLVDGRPEGAVLVDFGIARREAIQHNITRTGAIIGTVGYMAPEQLQGARDIDARADLFSLGCLAFELFCGRPAFEGANLGAVLGRLLFGEPPRLRDAAPSMPEPIEAFVSKLLESDREQRFASATQVVAALDELEPLTHLIGAPTEHATSARTRASLHTERTPVAMVLVLPSPASQTSAPETLSATATELSSDERVVDLTAAHRACELAAKHWGARVSSLADGLVLSFTQTSAIQERVHRAARAALDVFDALPGWRVSLLLSHEQRSRAGTRIDEIASEPEIASERELPTGVLVDASAAAFLGDEFERDGLVLTAFVPSRDEARKVLGRSAPCLGRDKELRLIEGTLDECIDEETCRALILRASAGVGKSRIRREFVARVRDQGQVGTLVCRCDVGSPAISLGVIRAWIAEALELRGHPAATRYALLRERVLPRLRPSGGESAEQLLEFFAELANVVVPEPSPLLLDARTNAREMRRMLQLALEAWLRAETQAAPLILVLEDLHWADPSSMSLLTSSWPTLDEIPLLLLITTWPEAEDAHPAVFGLKGAQILDVAPLGKRASERLARQLLGDSLPPEQLARLVEIAGGNAFLLEELLRHVGAGHSLASFPGSAIAMVQARLTELAPEARRLLRAASVLGERFDLAAVEAMCGTDLSQYGVEDLLERLTRAELLIPPSADEQGQTGAWAFRHSLVRQAAYELLTAEDRVLAHLAAARWLANQSSVDPASIAGHFEQAEAWNEAAPWFLAAVQERDELGDFEAVIALTARIDRPDIDGNLHAELVFRGSTARLYAGDMAVFDDLDQRMQQAEFLVGSPGWAAVLASLLSIKIHTGMLPEDCPEFASLDQALAVMEPSDPAIFGLCMLTVSLWHVGSIAAAQDVAALLRTMTSTPDTPPGRVALRNAYVPWINASEDPRALAEHRHGTELARQHCGLMRQVEILGPYTVFLCEFGLFDAAAELLAEVQRVAPPKFFDLDGWTLLAQLQLNLASPAPRDRRDLLDGVAQDGWLHLAPLVLAHAYASPSHADPTRPELAREALAAVEPLLDTCGSMASSRASVQTVLAELALSAGEPARALVAAELALGPPVLLLPRTHARAVLSRLRALAALGRGPEAEAEAERERKRLRTYLAGLEPDDREAFASMASIAGILEFRA